MEWYQQTTPYTTAVCSLMMALNHLDASFPLTAEMELGLWQQSVVCPTKSPSIYALASLAKQRNVPVRVVVGAHEYKFPRYRFQGYKLMEVEFASKVSELLYRKALREGIEIEERDFDFTESLGLLNEGKILLLRLNTGCLRQHSDKLMSHYLTIFMEREAIKLADPLRGINTVDAKLIEQSFLAVQEKSKRDNRMMVLG